MRILLTERERAEIETSLSTWHTPGGWEAANACWVKHVYPIVGDVEHVTVQGAIGHLLAILAHAEVEPNGTTPLIISLLGAKYAGYVDQSATFSGEQERAAIDFYFGGTEEERAAAREKYGPI